MFSKQVVGALTAMTALLTFGQQANAASSPAGVWLNDTGRGAIEIKRCGKKLCGHVVWTKSKKDKKGCGKKIIGNVSRVSKSTWDNGWIYSPKRGRKFSVELRRMKSGKLRVVGYAGSKFFSKTMYWKPAPADLVRCDDVKATPQIEAKAATKDEQKSAKTAPEKKIDKSEKQADKEVAAVVETDTKPTPAKKAETSNDDDVAKTDDDASEATDENDEYAEDEDEGGSKSFKVGDLSLDDLPLDKFFKKTDAGRCKLDTPWIKLDFNCKN